MEKEFMGRVETWPSDKEGEANWACISSKKSLVEHWIMRVT